MATTDQRSGFRLPWSSDRAHDSQPAEDAAPTADEPVAEAAEHDVAWPESDFNSRLGLTSQPRPAEATDTPETTTATNDNAATAVTTGATGPAAEEPKMIDQDLATAPAQAIAPRKPSKLMADLSAAIRATAESARVQALSQLDADVAQVTEAIRSGSKEGEDALRKQSDQDVISIKDWSRAEIARIKEETDAKIDARKATLTAELGAHAAAIQGRVGEVEGTADAYRAQMVAYADRLGDEDDPALLATMAESMPDAPSLDSLADLGSLEWEIPAIEPEPEAELAIEIEPEAELQVESIAEPVEDVVSEPEPEATAQIDTEAAPMAYADGTAAFEDGDGSDGSEEALVAELEPAEAIADVEAIGEVGEADALAEPVSMDDETTEASAIADAEPAMADGDAGTWGEPAAGGPWGDEASSWSAEGAATAVATDDDGTPRWAAGETPDGFPTGEEAGDPVDRGAIMAALEAAAEAVVAAESAAESAGQAEAAADVAETAAELLTGRVGTEDQLDPEAHAAMAARVDAGGVEESYTDRLAKLLPNHPEGETGTEPRTTQVIVSGLVSVASIASFKRHLGRIGGVQNVAVASGPDGEFVFNVTHRPEVSFRDSLPAMPGFAARVTSQGDGVVQVAARDPEAEG